MSAIGKWTGGPRARAAGAALLVGGMLTYAGVAGAAADRTIKALGAGTSSHWDVSEPVEIQTGQSVSWNFADPSLPAPKTTHNVTSTNTSATDPRWEGFKYPGPGDFDDALKGTETEYTFYKSGTYDFVCSLHPLQMTGTVVVTGEDKPIPTPTETPTATPTASPTATATATASPGPGPGPGGGTPPAPDPHTHTPAPKPTTDGTKPVLSSIKSRGLRRAVVVRFKLSEASTVTLQVRKRGARKVLRSVHLQARAGTRTVLLRSSKLRKGRYTVTLSARDAVGNASTAQPISIRIRR